MKKIIFSLITIFAFSICTVAQQWEKIETKAARSYAAFEIQGKKYRFTEHTVSEGSSDWDNLIAVNGISPYFHFKMEPYLGNFLLFNPRGLALFNPDAQTQEVIYKPSLQASRNAFVHDQYIFLEDKFGLYRTDEQAVKWDTIAFFPNQPVFQKVHEKNGNLHLFLHDTLFESFDFGTTWSFKRELPKNTRQVLVEKDKQWLWTRAPDKIYTSQDFFQSYTVADSDTFDFEYGYIPAFFEWNDTLHFTYNYVYDRDKHYFSSDQGKTWKKAPLFPDVAASAGYFNHIFKTDKELLISTEDGIIIRDNTTGKSIFFENKEYRPIGNLQATKNNAYYSYPDYIYAFDYRYDADEDVILPLVEDYPILQNELYELRQVNDKVLLFNSNKKWRSSINGNAPKPLKYGTSENAYYVATDNKLWAIEKGFYWTNIGQSKWNKLENTPNVDTFATQSFIHKNILFIDVKLKNDIYYSRNEGASWLLFDKSKCSTGYSHTLLGKYRDGILVACESNLTYAPESDFQNFYYITPTETLDLNIIDEMTGRTLNDISIETQQRIVWANYRNRIFAAAGNEIFEIDQNTITLTKIFPDLPEGSIRSLSVYSDGVYAGTKSNSLWKLDVPLQVAVEEGELLCSPNPVRSYLDIQIGETKNGNLQVFNAAGQRVINEFLDEIQQFRIEVQDWASGLYFIRFEDTEGVRNAKFVKH